MKKFFTDLISSFNIAGIYIFLWYLALLTQNEIIVVPYVGQLCLLSALSISIYAFVKLWNIKSIPYLQGAKMLVILFTFYGIVLIIDTPVIHLSFNGQNNQSYWFLEEVYKSILPIFAFFYLTIKGKLTRSNLQIWTVLFVIQAYYIYMNFYQGKDIIQSSFETTNIVNSMAYLFIAIIPGVPLFKRQYLQYVIFALCLIMVLLAMKRGALLIGALTLLWYVYVQSKVYAKKKNVVRIVFLAFFIYLILYGLMYVYNSILLDNAFFQERLDETLAGGTSGRDRISLHFWNYYLNEMNFLEEMFGIGAYGTIRTYINFAHNDWLEILICEGLLGIVCYIIYWLKLYKTIKLIKGYNSIFVILTLFAIIQFLKTFFSMSINDMMLYTTAPVGYALGQLYLQKSNRVKVNVEID